MPGISMHLHHMPCHDSPCHTYMHDCQTKPSTCMWSPTYSLSCILLTSTFISLPMIPSITLPTFTLTRLCPLSLSCLLSLYLATTLLSHNLFKNYRHISSIWKVHYKEPSHYSWTSISSLFCMFRNAYA